MLVSVASEATWGNDGGLRVTRLPPISMQQRNGTFVPASLVHAPQPLGFTGILLVPGSGLQRATFMQILQVCACMRPPHPSPAPPPAVHVHLSCQRAGYRARPQKHLVSGRTADGCKQAAQALVWNLPEGELMALWVMQGAADTLQPVLAVDVTAHKPLLDQTLTWLMTRNRIWCVVAPVHTSAAARLRSQSAPSVGKAPKP
jgi:hypothetical protein